MQLQPVGVGVVLNNLVTQTSGKLVSIQNNGSEKAYVDYIGNLNAGLGSVNNVTIAGGTTGNPVTITATGTDTNIGISLVSKGSGAVTAVNGLATNSVNASSSSVLALFGAPIDASNAVGAQIGSSTSLANTSAKLLSILNSSTEKAYFDKDGGLTLAGGGTLTLLFTDNSGSPGATTINKPTGRAAIASGASSVVVTNSVVSATSIVHVQTETVGVGVADLVVAPAAGSFTVTSVNATGAATVTTGNLTFSFVVYN